MRQLIAFTQRITPWVQKRRHTRHTVRCGQNQQAHSAHNGRHQYGKILPREACQKQHTHGNNNNHDKRAEIRLAHNQNQTDRHQHNRQNQGLKLAETFLYPYPSFTFKGAAHQIANTGKQRRPTQRIQITQHFFTTRKQAGQIQDRRQFEKFSRLQVERSNMNPARRTVNLAADKQNQQQQQTRNSKIKRNNPPPETHLQQEKRQAYGHRKQDKHCLLRHKRKLAAPFRCRIRNRSRINHNQAEDRH